MHKKELKMVVGKQFVFFILSIGILILSGCETLYIPNAVHSPMLSNKGEGHVSTSLGCIGSGLANVDAAYAISDHIGIMADGMFHYKTSTYNDYTYLEYDRQTMIYYGSLGLGYFEKVGTKDNFVMQFYGGGGFGDSRSFTNDDYETNVTANYYNFYAQPGMAINSKYLDFGFDFRMNYVQLYNFKAYYFDPTYGPTDPNTYNADYKREFVLVEPNFTLMVGGRHLKGKLQSGFTIPIINGEGYFDSNEGAVFKLNMGITYIFGRKQPVKVQF